MLGAAILVFVLMGILTVVALCMFFAPIIQEDCKRKYYYEKMPERVEDGHCDELGFALSAMVGLLAVPALIVLYIYVIKPFLLS